MMVIWFSSMDKLESQDVWSRKERDGNLSTICQYLVMQQLLVSEGRILFEHKRVLIDVVYSAPSCVSSYLFVASAGCFPVYHSLVAD